MIRKRHNSITTSGFIAASLYLSLLAGVPAFSGAVEAGSGNTQSPNVIYILADDLGYG